MTGSLAGSTILVTGAGGGIGAATGRLAAQRGAWVVLTDVNDAGETTAASIRDAGGTAVFRRLDVTDAEAVAGLVAEIADEYGRLDAAVNNAGVDHPHARLADVPAAEWERVHDVNLRGVWHCMVPELRQMKAQGRGAIVNVASVAGLVGAERFGVYAASKHGVVGLTRSAAADYARHGIRVNCVCPGVIRTEMFERSLRAEPRLEESLSAKHPTRRLGLPEEVAEAILWLCSDGASFVHGHALAVDGGFTAV
ncbi:SDR family oxidoreductase [Ectothiorhodospiraceae bacterium WFHF3C12]|nr:SDR family oxidoreductase [Ectothiorhodospiraceae bacterium WFHF3C12]